MSPIIVPTTSGETFDDLLGEFYLRGFDYLDQDATGRARAKRWVNAGYQDLLEEEEWPFLFTTANGAAPLDLTDVREVLSVSGANGELAPSDKDELLKRDPTLSASGSGSDYYVDGTTVHTWPADTSTSLTVRYIASPPELVADDDEPIVPPRYRHLIVEYAVMRALRDRSNFEEAKAVWEALQLDLNRMRDTLVDQVWFQRLTDPHAA